MKAKYFNYKMFSIMAYHQNKNYELHRNMIKKFLRQKYKQTCTFKVYPIFTENSVKFSQLCFLQNISEITLNKHNNMFINQKVHKIKKPH